MENIVIVFYREVMSRYVSEKTTRNNLSEFNGIPNRLWKAERQKHGAGREV
jgi:hypothetical protein